MSLLKCLKQTYFLVTIPELTAELAEQIVSQAAAQQAAGEHSTLQTSAGEGILIQSSAGMLHVPEGGASQGTGQPGMVIGTEVMVRNARENEDAEVSLLPFYNSYLLLR